MKKNLFFIILLFSLICVIVLLFNQVKRLDLQLADAQNNTKTLMNNNSDLNDASRTLKLTIEQLEYTNDSISKRLIETIKDCNIQKNKIKQLQYELSTNFKIDTITFKDTLLVNNVNVDTTITDSKWYSLNLKLKSPNLFVVNPKFVNENVTLFSYKKETVNPPKKFFLCRWLQKKHIVTEITVVNNNPYCNIDTTRFIEIVKY